MSTFGSNSVQIVVISIVSDLSAERDRLIDTISRSSSIQRLSRMRRKLVERFLGRQIVLPVAVDFAVVVHDGGVIAAARGRGRFGRSWRRPIRGPDK